MAPLDCNDFVTAWLPLAPVPSIREGGSPLVFASRSHRDFALNHWQDPRLRDDLSGRYSKKHYAPLNAGKFHELHTIFRPVVTNRYPRLVVMRFRVRGFVSCGSNSKRAGRACT